jgi:hypothetical protein
MRELIDVRLLGLLVMVAFLTTLVLSLMGVLGNFSSGSSDRQVERTSELIDKAMFQCYALEGSYPPDLDYLADNYGVVLYADKFFYYYETIGSNIKPIVYITPRTSEAS